MSETIYLDNHATTRLDPRVLEAMLPFWSEQGGNPSSPHHAPARWCAAAVDTARQQVADLLQAEPREIVFTSGATEANNLAILGVLRASPPGSHLVASAIEHASVLEPAERLRREGHEVTVVPVDRLGRVDPDAIAAAITARTALVSVMTANNEIGTIQPMAEIAERCRKQGVLFHTDAVQAASTLPLPFAKWSVDLASLSSHKMYGPMGIGALFVRRKTPRIPLGSLVFGGSQEGRRRAGTLATPLIVGFGAACRLAMQSLPDEPQKIATVRDRLWTALTSRLNGLTRNGDPAHCLPGNLHFSISGIDGDVLLTALQDDLALSSGAACSASEHKLSHVLHAVGLDEFASKSSLRIGVGRFNTEADADRAADILVTIISRLQASTPAVRKQLGC